MKNTKYGTVGTVPKSNRKITETDKIYTPSTHIHSNSLSLLGTGTRIKRGGAILVLWT
jgi:hypothetical protein